MNGYLRKRKIIERHRQTKTDKDRHRQTDRQTDRDRHIKHDI